MSPTLIALDDEFQLLTGMAFGLAQSTVIVHAAIDDVPAGVAARVAAALPDVLEEAFPGFAPGEDEGAGAIARLLAFCAGALQRQSRIGISGRFHVRGLGPTASGQLRFELGLPSNGSRKAALLAVQAAAQLLARTVQDGWSRSLGEGFAKRADDVLRPFAEPGMNRFLLMRAALEQDIPVRPWVDRYLLLGTGTHTRWVESTVTDRTPMLGAMSARNKQRTAWMLREAGLPGGHNIAVDKRESAVEAARRLGYPVVVKPNDRDRGEGVAADLRDAESVARAFDEAAKLSPAVLVEKWFPGYTHRLNVRFGRVDRCARKIAGVVGDGSAAMGELVRRMQQTPAHRALARMHGRQLLQLDEEALALLRQDGRDAGYVPAAGEYVRLRRRDNAATGGTNEELDIRDPGVVHPDNIRLAEEAARVLMLDIAGVDLIMQDISRSWFETGALICEVNVQPQIPRMDLIAPLVKDLVGGGSGRIPAVLHVCPAHPAASRELAARLSAGGKYDGISEAGGVSVHGVRATGRFANGFGAARALLMRRDVASAACVMSAADVAAAGLPLDRWDEVHFAPAEAFTPAEAPALAAARRFLLAYQHGAH